jgi:carbamoyl-phosphate synthase large subunit
LEVLQTVPVLAPFVPVFRLTSTEDEFRSGVRDLGYPEKIVAVKPPVSNGMRGFRLLTAKRWDLQRFLTEKPSGIETTLEDLVLTLSQGAAWPKLLVSEYLPGPEYTVDVFRGKYVQIALPRIRRSIRSGISFDNIFEFRRDLMEASLRIAETVGLDLIFGFQFKLDASGQPKLLECNPRVQGTMVASVFAGANLIWMAVRELLGDPVREIHQPLRTAAFLRYWGGLGIVDNKCFEI